MRVAFEGATTTRRLIDESGQKPDGIDVNSEPPPHTVQSTQELDDAVESHLENQLVEAIKNGNKDDIKYYKHQLKLFKKFREFHDTFVIGKDKQGRTYIISISNKKGSDMRDPQNNTTPAQRMRALQREFGSTVAQTVTDTMDDAITSVSNAAETTIQAQSQMTIDQDVVDMCHSPKMKKYMDTLDEKADPNRKRPHKFSKWLAGPPKRKWPTGNSKAAVKKKLELMQEYVKGKLEDKNGNLRVQNCPASPGDHYASICKGKADGKYYLNDANVWIKINGVGDAAVGLPYEPFGKIAAKLGENKTNTETGGIKQKEKDVVKQAHIDVVDSLFDADKPDSYPNPKTADNGTNTQAYISGVLNALHIEAFIDLDDDDDDRMLVQMGINGVKPSMVRECVAEQSGYNEWAKKNNKKPTKKGLKEYLKKRCRVAPGGDRVTVNNGKGDVELFTDAWRTAGSGGQQKVASGFGEGMRECLIEKAAA